MPKPARKTKKAELTDAALLGAFVGGTAKARTLLDQSSLLELSRKAGVELGKNGEKLAALFELGRRVVFAAHAPGLKIDNGQEVYRYLAPRYSGLKQEVFTVLGVDARGCLVVDEVVAIGTLTGVSVHPREVFRLLITHACAGAVIAHNHPSGDPTPSSDDIELTDRMVKAGEMIGIPILDHVIVGRGGWRSVRDVIADLNRADV